LNVPLRVTKKIVAKSVLTHRDTLFPFHFRRSDSFSSSETYVSVHNAIIRTLER